MKLSHYITATEALLREGQEVERIISHLTRALNVRGHQALLPRILRGLVQAFERRGREQQATIAVACADDVPHLRTLINSAKEAMGAARAPETVHVDTTLIGGARVSYQGRMLDRTDKRALLELARSVSSST